MVHIPNIETAKDTLSIEDFSKVIRREKPHLLSLQLVHGTQINKLKQEFDEYIWVEGKVNNNFLYMPVAFHKQHYDLQTKFFFQLDNQLTLPGNACCIVNGIKLRNRYNGRTFVYFNVYIQRQPPLHINQIVFNLHQIIVTYADRLPIVIGGSFGFAEKTSPYELLTGVWQNFSTLHNPLEKSAMRNIPDYLILSNEYAEFFRIQEHKNPLHWISCELDLNHAHRGNLDSAKPYPMDDSQPDFADNRIVFTRRMDVKIANPNPKIHVVYTLDESVPDIHSQVYHYPIRIDHTQRIKIRAIQKNREKGPVRCRYFIQKTPIPYSCTDWITLPSLATPADSLQFLTDTQKGDEDMAPAQWARIAPEAVHYLYFTFEKPIKLEKVFLSFASIGGLQLPQINLLDATNYGHIHPISHSQQLLPGGAGICGKQGWMVLNLQTTLSKLCIRFNYSQSKGHTLYLDEIAFQSAQ